MARPLRLEYPGAVYHVMARGQERGAIYREDGDRERFLDELSRVVVEQRWVVHGYCLMTNHDHLLVETPEANLSTGMQLLNGRYSQAFNVQWSRKGHLFEDRYKAIVVEKESYLLELCRYVVLNPVRAPDGALASGVALEQLPRDVGRGRDARVPRGVELPRAIPRAQRQVGFFGLAEVIAAVAEELGIAEEELSEAWRRGDERAVAVTLARRLTGASGVEIGKRFGVTSARVSQLVRKVEESKDPKLTRCVSRIEDRLRRGPRRRGSTVG
jgi:REP element-mobilizing transposase RayT